MTEPGISALETLWPRARARVHEGVLTPLAATERLTRGPARIAGLDAGTITVGSAADLVLLDPRHPWTLRAEHLRSAGHHTPFEGHGFKGCAPTTLHRGEVVFPRSQAIPSTLDERYKVTDNAGGKTDDGRVREEGGR